MNKKIIFLIVPLVMISQEVFSASFNQNSYNVPSPTTGLMQNNIPNLQEDTKFYNSNIQNELNNIQRNTLPELDSQYFLQEQENLFDKAEGSKNYNPMTIQQHNQPEKLENFIQREQETPKWWRQENSYQGWGFN